MSNGFLLALDKCTGCDACQLACTIENDLPPGTSWRQVVTFNARRHPTLPVFHLSLACNHCSAAPCQDACPTLAYSRDPETGALLLDPSRCIGCGYCAWACPFDAPRYDEDAGVMTKCTLCNRRLAAGDAPACVAACPTGALGYGALEGSGGTAAVPGFPRTRAEPRIRFAPLKSRIAAPAGGAPSTAGAPGSGTGRRDDGRKTGLASEWPLAVFSLTAAFLVAWIGASLFGDLAIASRTFMFAALAGMALSSLHLGKKQRAWRALLNVRRSWLSREIAGYSLFVALAGCLLFVAPDVPALRVAVLVTGAVALFCIDRVYDVLRSAGPVRLHSADVLLTAAFLTAVLSGRAAAALLLGAVKAVLYVGRYYRVGFRAGRYRGAVAAVRLLAGFAVPAAVWLMLPEISPVWAVAGVMLGEIVDRCEFYDGLDASTPQGQVAADLQTALRNPGETPFSPSFDARVAGP